jgi:hypothetical protein
MSIKNTRNYLWVLSVTCDCGAIKKGDAAGAKTC